MGKYIKGDRLHIGNNKKEIKQNMADILNYIYRHIPLDHDKMKPLYKDIKVPISFGDRDDFEYNDHYRYKLVFLNYPDTDEEYIYEFDDNDIDPDYYENYDLVSELHNYLLKNSPEKLQIGNYQSIKLSNHKKNDDVRGVRYLDWKLHKWVEFCVGNETSVSIDDLITAAYKIRSHKFENNYEMFSGIDYVFISGKDISIGAKFVNQS